MTTTVKTAGLIDGDGICVNAILVEVDDETNEVVGYKPAEGLSLIVDAAAGVGKKWNGKEFADGK